MDEQKVKEQEDNKPPQSKISRFGKKALFFGIIAILFIAVYCIVTIIPATESIANNAIQIFLL